MEDGSGPYERLDHLIASCLGRIDSEADRVCQGAEAADPDAVMAALDRETERLSTLIDLETARTGSEPPGLDLNAVIRRCSEDLLTQIGLPVVLVTRLEPDLPRLSLDRRRVVPLVERVLALGIAMAGRAGEMRVTTRCEDGSLLLELKTLPGLDGPAREIACNEIGLVETVRGLGGRLDLGLDEHHCLHLALEFGSWQLT